LTSAGPSRYWCRSKLALAPHLSVRLPGEVYLGTLTIGPRISCGRRASARRSGSCEWRVLYRGDAVDVTRVSCRTHRTADPLAVSFGARRLRRIYALNNIQSSHASVLHLGSIDRCGLSNPVGRAPSLIRIRLAQEGESIARASNEVQSVARMRHRS